MTFPLFKVNKTGLLTSFQDLGRPKHQSKGVVASGAMDARACQLANLLVGNPYDEACIEVAIQGPTLTVLAEEATIAICGAPLSPTINGTSVSMWKTLHLKEGDKLQFEAPKAGVYAYIAVRGGYTVPSHLGSKAYFNKARLGAAIKNGDSIYGESKLPDIASRGLRHDFHYPKEVNVRVILGPHKNHFTKEDIQRFFTQPYQVRQGDRMGYRLYADTPLSSLSNDGIASDAIPLGGIQVPEDGYPIILLADRQTTGGYRRIGTVIQADIPKLVQVPAGGTVYFEETTLEEAYEALLEQQRFIKQLALITQN
jgi:antagonist of KipI